MRLLKLFRIVKASRLVVRWTDRIEHYISISHSTRTLLWWMFIILCTIHWFSCSWGLVAQLQTSQRTDALKEIPVIVFSARSEQSVIADCLWKGFW